MQEYVLTVPRRSDAEAILELVHKRLAATGEFNIRRTENGKWRVTLMPEQTFSAKALMRALPKRLREKLVSEE